MTFHGRTVVVVGDAFVAHGSESLESNLQSFVLDDDWAALDALSGRFALIVFDDEHVRALTDPFGSRSISYRLTGPRLMASHASLVAELAGERPSSTIAKYTKSAEYLSKRTRFLPGDYTMYSNIVRLAPNNYYDLTVGRCVRYWPRHEISPTSLTDFHDIADEYFANYAHFLRRTYVPVLGLTGGVDSRAVIAALMAHGAHPRLSTWSNLPPDEMSRLRPMIAHLGLEHEYVDVTEVRSDPDFQRLRDAAHVNTGLWRGRSLLPAQAALTAGANDVFVRGYGGEILRGSYHSSQMGHRGSDLEVFVKLYNTRAVKDPSEDYRTFTTRAFQQFMQRANYGDNTFNADSGDLVYWEQRMGMWAADLLNELDPAMPSHTGINSRPLYEAAWGLPDAERFGTQLLLGLMSRYDPRLAAL